MVQGDPLISVLDIQLSPIEVWVHSRGRAKDDVYRFNTDDHGQCRSTGISGTVTHTKVWYADILVIAHVGHDMEC
jgi:hypothetical protein